MQMNHSNDFPGSQPIKIQQSFKQTSCLILNSVSRKSLKKRLILSSKISKKVQFSSFNMQHYSTEKIVNIESSQAETKDKTVINLLNSQMQSSLSDQQPKKKSILIQHLSEINSFICRECSTNQKDRQCMICKNKKTINGNSNFIKFIEYLLEFKMGKRNGYENRKNARKTSINSHCDDFYKNVDTNEIRKSLNLGSPVTYHDLKQRINVQSFIHQGYKCDICDIQPIEGTRYHCTHIDCENNFDLCHNCYNDNEHCHKNRMQEIKSTGIQQKLKVLMNILQKSTNLGRSSNIERSSNATSIHTKQNNTIKINQCRYSSMN